MKFERSSGILLHPTSLPSPYGIGDLGKEAYRWLDFLAETGCRLWQVLPLGPTGYGDSPYQCFSAFAGNPYLISPAALVEDGLLTQAEIDSGRRFPTSYVDFGEVIPWKLDILGRAYQRFTQSASAALRQAFEEFQHQQAAWLPDFAFFMALKEYHGGGSWVSWSPDLRKRKKKALKEAAALLADAIQQQVFRQFIFFRQWNALRDYAHSLNIQIIGDIPYVIAHDSADVWAHPELFYLDKNGNPTVVAGVPPDYFSATGQLWGNPLYNWSVHKENGYAWWVARFRAILDMVDIVRLDHFRGFAGYWEVPAGMPTAEKGRWAPGPGADLFHTLEKELGDLPIIAEDLGVITEDVVALREKFNLPGMRIVQFAFAGGPRDPFLPHNHEKNSVVYTGTHDNDTVLGWYQRVDENERSFYRRYMGRDGSDVSWDLIRATWSSVAVFALAPMQDFLSLDNQARMNYPGRQSGNWSWRMPAHAMNSSLAGRIREFNYLYDREKPKSEPENAQAAKEAQ